MIDISSFQICLAPLPHEIKVLAPFVMRFDNLFRMYYSACDSGLNHSGAIKSAISSDCLSWNREPGFRMLPDEAERVIGMCVIKLDDGSFRMYYHARISNNPGKIYSAISQDGFAWEKEPGVRVSSDNDDLGSPYCVQLKDGSFRLYFHFYTNFSRLSSKRNIASAISSDGINFEIEDGVRVEQTDDDERYAVYAPSVVEKDDSWSMYYGAWADQKAGCIKRTVSADGLLWEESKEVILAPGSFQDFLIVSEPCVVRRDGFRDVVFFEFLDVSRQWKIGSVELDETQS